jgi:hypothetical protein
MCFDILQYLDDEIGLLGSVVRLGRLGLDIQLAAALQVVQSFFLGLG